MIHLYLLSVFIVRFGPQSVYRISSAGIRLRYPYFHHTIVSTPVSIAIIATTIISSMSVNPLFFVLFLIIRASI